MSLEGLVDSVTVMRFRSQVRKELGKTLSLEELNENPTIAQQATILDRQQESVLHGSENPSEPVRDGSPGLTDLVHARGKPALFNDIKQKAESKLRTFGLSWDEDVEEVLPIYDFLQLWRTNTDSQVFRIAFTCTGVTMKQIHAALTTVMPRHGMLRTIRVDSTLAGPSWVMLRSNHRWYDLAIKEVGALNKPEDLLTADLSDGSSQDSVANKPLPLFHINIYSIEVIKGAGFAVYGDHSSYDAHSVLSLFIEDFGKALYTPDVALPSRPAYNIFANSYYNYRMSVPAQLRLDYYVSYLEGISQRRGGLWPKETFQSVNGHPSRTADQLLLRGDIKTGLAGIAKHIKIDMSNNQYLRVHKIPHFIAIKAAIAIYNSQQTGHPYAMWMNLQMCRTYPFLDRRIADRLPDPMDMPGATIEAPYDNIHINPSETVSSLLQRLQVDQNDQTARAQFPMLELHNRLNSEDSDFLHEVFRRQAVNYNPVVTPDPNAPIQNVQFAGTANLSFMWWCGMVDAETVQMRVTWNDEVMGVKEAEAALEGFERNMKWLVAGETWERSVGDCPSH